MDVRFKRKAFSCQQALFDHHTVRMIAIGEALLFMAISREALPLTLSTSC